MKMSVIKNEVEPGDSEYVKKDVDDKILLNLRDLGQRIPFLYEGKDSQRRALIFLRNTGDVSQRELTQKLSIKPGSMSEVLKKLSDKGFIVRTPSDDDRRTMIVSLTDEGTEIADAALEYRQERRCEMFSSLDNDEKVTLLNLLEKINTE
jgi:DNA-binding MarR family transcriptional regulator